jgi:DNA-binding MarR family transcriptional regulator
MGRLDPAAKAGAVRLGALAGLLGYHVAQTAVLTEAVFEQHVGQPLQLRKTEFSLLALLLANGALTPRRLAQQLSLSAPSLTLLLDRLQARALIERSRNPLDGRSQHVRLSTAGQRLAQASTDAAARMEQELLARLSSAEQAMLIELLARLTGPSARTQPADDGASA